MSPKIMVMERKMPRGAALWLAFAFCQLLCIAGQAQTANDPNVTVSPNGTNNIVYNAITESISFPAGYSQVQYSVNGGPWTSYTGPFTIDGNDPRYPFTPGGSAHGATLQVCFNNGTTVSTNTYTPALFEIAPLVGNPPMNPAISGSGGAYLFTNIQGPVTVTMSTATAGATIVYAQAATNQVPWDQDQYDAMPGLTNVYTGPIQITGNAGLCFEAYKSNYFRLGQYSVFAYTFTVTNDSNLGMAPNNAIVNNAITETISIPSGYSSVQYSLNGGAWTPYTGPFTIDGNDPRYPFTPGGSAHGATLQVSFNDGSVFWTNTYTPALFEVAPLVGNPPMNPAISGSGGAYLFTNIQGPLSVTMSTATAGATIVYAQAATNQVPWDPNQNNTVPGITNVYTGPIQITGNAGLCFEAYKTNYFRFGQYWMFAYTFTVTNDQSLSVSPNNAIVSNAITETISVPGGYSSVQYSLNGGSWTDYTGPFTIDGNNPNVPVNAGSGATGANLAVRFYDGSMFWTNSYIPAYFMIAPLVASPVPNIGDYYYYNSNLVGSATVTISTATEGATIVYDLSHVSTPEDPNLMSGSPTLTNIYTGPITITNRSYLMFEAYKPNYFRWNMAPYYVQMAFLQPLQQPVFDPPSGTTFSNATAITITEPDAYIPGSATDTTTNAQGQIDVSGESIPAFFLEYGNTGYYLAAADNWNYTSSGGVTENYSIQGPGTYVATLRTGSGGETAPAASATYNFVVNELTTTSNCVFNAPLTVQASSPSGNSEYPPLAVYYTTDGTLPTTSSAQLTSANGSAFVGSLTISNTTTVIWMGARSFGPDFSMAAYTPQYVTNFYTYAQPVSASPPPGTYSNAINIALTGGSGIIYSLDDQHWLSYTNPIYLDGYGNGTATLQTSYTGALTNQLTYTFQAAPPVISPPSTNFVGALVVTAVPGTYGGTVMYSIENPNGGLLQDFTAYTNAITNTTTCSYTMQTVKSGYLGSSYTTASYVSLNQTIIMVTNLSTLTIYNNRLQGSPYWELYEGTGPNNYAPAQFAYVLPGQVATMTLQNNELSYFAYAITTNGGTNFLVVPLTLAGTNAYQTIWTGSYNGQGNAQTTSYQNPGVNTVASTTTNSSTGTVTVQNAQNPSSLTWQFPTNVLQADPLTAQPFTSVYLNAYQSYMISIQGTNSGQYNLLAQLRELPSNDYFSNALTWSPQTTNGLPTSISSNGYNIYATTEPGEQLVMGGQTVWYQILPVQGGTYSAQVTGYGDQRFLDIVSSAGVLSFSLLNPELTLWQGTNLSNLVLQADSKVPNPSTAVNPYNFPGTISCVMQPSSTYYLRIDASASPGEYNLTQTFYPLANNDDFANATPLQPTEIIYDNGIRYEYSQTGGNYGATTEQGEPLVDSHSVWYTITIPALAYFQAAAVSQIPTNNITVYPYIIPNGAGVTLTNLVPLANGSLLASNTVVYLAVCGDQTEFNLFATNTVPPANDMVSNALILQNSAPSTTTYYVYDSFATATDPLDVQIPGANNSIWWTVDPEVPGTLTVISTDGAYPTTYWQLFNGTTLTQPIDTTSSRCTYNVLPNIPNLFKLTVPNADEGDGHVQFILYAGSTNDSQQSPTPITSYSTEQYADGLVYEYTITDMDNGTNQTGAPFNHCAWYDWSAPESGYASVSLNSTNVAYQISETGKGMLTNPVFCNLNDNLTLAVGGNIDRYTLDIDFRAPPSNDEMANAIPVPVGQDMLFYSTYGTMSTVGVPPNGVISGAADLWCTYDPTLEMQAAFYVAPATNGQAITLQVIQENTVIGQQTFNLMSQPPLNISFTDTNLVTLRTIVAQSNTDFTLSVQSQANNDVFTNREIVTLRPSTVNVSVNGNIMPLTKYTAHIVSDNLNATTEPGEPIAGFMSRDGGTLADRPLWWQVTTPVQGVFSIKQRETSDMLSIEVCTNPVVDEVPHSVWDFFAWNSTTTSANNFPSDTTVAFVSAKGQTYDIRVDSLVGGTGRVDFDISQIQAPSGDPMGSPVAMTQSGGPQTYYYKGQYPYTIGGYNYSSLATIYGATREMVNGELEDQEETFLAPSGPLHLAFINGQLPLYPAWQTLWETVTPITTTRYTIGYSVNFTPMVLETPQSPWTQGNYQQISPNQELTLNQGQTYYFLIDAMTPPALTFSGNPAFFLLSTYQACDTPLDGMQGLNTDVNRDCEDAIAGVIAFNLTPSATPANDSILTPTPLVLSEGFVNDSCTEPYGNLYVKYAENNYAATSETATNLVDADWLGGNGQTLWWTVQALVTGPMYITTSDSQVPAIVKVFPDEDYLSGGYLFTNGQATFQALAGQNYLIGMDSIKGTNGILAFTIYQTPTSPVNDNFNGALPISAETMCGTLNGSTIQQYENATGTGSIWYQVDNNTPTNQTYTFTLGGDTAFMDLYQNAGNYIQNCVPEVLASTTITYTAAPGEVDYIRVYSTNNPPSGNITLTSVMSSSYYADQVQITPSQSFLASLTISAIAQPPFLPVIYHSPGGTTTNSTLYAGPFVITNSQTIDFLVQIPNLATYHVTNTYTQLPPMAITPSCVFTNQLLVTTGTVPPGTIVTYAQGPADGSPPTQQNAQVFPAGGLLVTNSAQVNFTVTDANGYTSAIRHYTNTVATPEFAAVNTTNAVMTITTATPGASLTVVQGGIMHSYPTNNVTLLAMSPQITAIASMTGWASSSNTYGFTPVSADLGAIQFATNSQTASELDVTLVNTNANMITWYNILHNGTTVISSNMTGNGMLQLYYTCDLVAFAGSPSMSIVGPQSTLHFTSTLSMPQMIQSENQLLVVNSNKVQSALYINGINMGNVSQATIPIVTGIQDTAYATSSWANTSPTNTFTPQFNAQLTFNPPSTNFNVDLPVTVSASEGLLSLVVQTATSPAISYPSVGSSKQVIMNSSGTIAATVSAYGKVLLAQTNAYTAQVGPVQYILPDTLPDGNYDSLNPVIFSCVTPNLAYQYRTSDAGNWLPLQNAGMLLQVGNYTYQVMATRAGWQSSPITTFSCTAEPNPNSLVDYVASYYTIYPDQPAEVTATNNMLVNFPPYSYENFVWMEGGQPATFLYLTTPGTYTIYHQVVKYEQNPTSMVSTPVQYGPTNYTVVQASYFDWQVLPTTGSSNQLGLVVSGNSNIYDNVYFYMPTYIQSWTNMNLAAIGNGVYYDMSPLRNPTNANIYLIPGNLNVGDGPSDCINLMYWYGNTTNYFKMKFRTLTPSQYRASYNQNVVVALASDYQYQNVGVFYDTNLSDAVTSPLPLPFPMTGVYSNMPYGTTNLGSLVSGTNGGWMINSKYNESSLTNFIPNGLPILNVYGQ